MTAKKTGLAAVAMIATWLCLAGTALAASSPTATLAAAASVTSTSATLKATIDPNGAKTTYQFNYGPTSVLGTTSKPKTIAAGTSKVTVSFKAGGLQSGTTYYYDVTATNAAGTVTTKLRTFKTGGNPPPAATTGGAQVLSSNTATVTGVVTPNGAATTYYFDWGTTPAEGQHTQAYTVAGTSGPATVSSTLSGLAPGTIFYYTLVATHGGQNAASPAAQETFETFPERAPLPPVGAATTPHVSHGSGPFTLWTKGHVRDIGGSPLQFACTGDVTIAFDHDNHRVFAEKVPLSSGCTFIAKTVFSHLPVRLPRGVHEEHLVVWAHFDGNPYLAAHNAAPQTIVVS